MEKSNKNFFELLSKMNREDYMKNFITYLISPVIAGGKPSSTVTLTGGIDGLYGTWQSIGKEYLKELQLDSIELRKDKDTLVILIYKKENLKKTLFKEDSIKFLSKIGYSKECNLKELLEILVERYNMFHCPHELGIFLGIPLEDVKAFMDCSEDKCLVCGYWKVYDNIEKAEKIFSYYDKSKDLAKEYILKRKDLSTIAYKIKENFMLV